MTQGRGIPNIEFSHYEEVPSDVAEKIIGRGVMRGQTKN
jgi:translation elongation factor EF-G